MREVALGVLLAALAVAPGAAALDVAEYDKAARAILCDCGCHPQSVHDCACGRAAEMRKELAGLIEEGKTGDDVIALYVAEHGEQILVAPPARGFNLVAWLGPLLGLVAASGGLLLLLRRWTAAPADPGTSSPQPAPAPPRIDEVGRARLRRELEDFR